MANTPVPPPNGPPRIMAPGPSVVLAPARHISSSLKLPHPGHAVESGAQSATHSHTLPTISNAPTLETQPERDPVETRSSGSDKVELVVLQDVIPLSGVSGVPNA